MSNTIAAREGSAPSTEWTDCDSCGTSASVEPELEVPAMKMNGRIKRGAYFTALCDECGTLHKRTK